MTARLAIYKVTTPIVHTSHMQRLWEVSARVLGTPKRWTAADYRLPERYRA